MASAGAIILIMLTFLVIVGTPTLFLIIKFFRFTRITGTKVLFEDTSRTYGSGISNLMNKKIGRNGRIIMTLLPLDKENPEPFKFISEPHKIDIRPKGVWWSDTDVIRVLPHSAVDWFANAFTEVEALNAKSNIEKAQREALDRQTAHIFNMAEGEATRQDMALQESLKNQIAKQSLKEDKTGKPGGYVSNIPRDTFT